MRTTSLALLLVAACGGAPGGTPDIINVDGPVDAGGPTWTIVATGTTADLESVAALGGRRYVAVGAGGVAVASDDAEQWSPHATGSTDVLTSVSHSLAGAIAVSLGGELLASSDGRTWSRRPLPGQGATLRAITQGAPSLVAVGDLATTAVLVDPGDPTAWSVRSSTGDGVYRGVAFAPGGANGMFAATGIGSGTRGVIRTSTNTGLTWQDRATDVPPLNGVVFSAALGRFVAAAAGEPVVYVSSPDGATWTPHTVAANGLGLNAIAACDDGTLVVANATGSASAELFVSSDGVAWTPFGQLDRRVLGLACGGEVVAAGPGGMVAVASIRP